MNGNSDKHKPLSPEELFRLLETKNEEALSDGELDDFEKEALEGFSAHTSAGKARQLTGELHDLIHKKLNEPEKKQDKGRIIWFSAAASLILGLIISAYMLVQHANNSQELALNKEVSGEKKNAAPAVQEPAGSSAAADEAKKESVPQLPARDAVPSESALEQPLAISENKVMHNYEVQDANGLKDGQLRDGFVKSKDALEKKQGQATTGYDDKFKLAEAAPGQEDQKVDFVANGTVAASKALSPAKGDLANTPPAAKAEKESSATTYESVEVLSTKTKQSLFHKRKKQATEDDADKSAAPTTSAPAKAEERNLREESAKEGYYKTGDYYTGGAQALKTKVEGWLKEQGYEAPKGTYRVRMGIGVDGTANVLELKTEKGGEENMLAPLKKSLEALRGWLPEAGQEVVFTLSF